MKGVPLRTVAITYLTAAEAAQILGMRTREVYRLINDGELVGYKLPEDPRVRVTEDDVRRLVASR